jgi:hypothetical protein
MAMESRNHRISVMMVGSMGRYAAVHLADYEDMGWHTDILNTGVGRYSDRKSAIIEARDWAEADGIPIDPGCLVSEL